MSIFDPPTNETFTCRRCGASYVDDKWASHTLNDCIDHLKAENARLRTLVDAAHQLADVAESTAATVTQMLGATPGTVGHTIAAGLTKGASLVREVMASSGRTT